MDELRLIQFRKTTNCADDKLRASSTNRSSFVKIMTSPQREQLDRAWEKYSADIIKSTLCGFGVVRTNDEWFRIRTQMDFLAKAEKEHQANRKWPVLPLEDVKYPLGNKYKGQKISEIAQTQEGLLYLQWSLENVQCLSIPDKFVEVRKAMQHYLGRNEMCGSYE